MQSAGNDIVALCGTDNERTNNDRFYRQILSVEEQNLYHTSLKHLLSFEQFVWAAWSVKESAYKYLSRSAPGLVFSPVKMTVQELYPPDASPGVSNKEEIDLANTWHGNLLLNDLRYYFKTVISKDYVSSVISARPTFKNMYWGIRDSQLPDADLPVAVRSFLAEKLVCLFHTNEMWISSSNGSFPAVYDSSGERLDIAISFSHHKGWVSYVLSFIEIDAV